MTLSNQIIHVIPLQVSIHGSNAIITCNDPRARIVDDEIELILNAPNPSDPPAQQRICFVVDDPPDAGGYDNYFNISSAPPLERLMAWKRSGTTSRSPELLTGHDFEIVAVAYSVPRAGTQPTTPVRVGHGRRRAKIRDAGAGGRDPF